MCDKNRIIKEIKGYGFYGFYESIYDGSDDFIDDENELKDELIEKYNLNNNEINVEYVYDDYKEYQLDVSTEYLKVFVEQFIGVLPDRITDDEYFLFEYVDKSVIVSSPKDYSNNYDKCYCNVLTNDYTISMIKDYALSINGSDWYIKKRWQSYDGCHYFIKNGYDYWRNLDVKDYDVLYLSALMELVLYFSDKNIFSELNFIVSDNISKYEYVYPSIEYNNKNYDLNEFIKLMSEKK